MLLLLNISVSLGHKNRTALVSSHGSTYLAFIYYMFLLTPKTYPVQKSLPVRYSYSQDSLFQMR